MRRLWEFLVPVVIVCAVGWNLLSGQPLFGGALPGVALALIAVTLSWWFSEAGDVRTPAPLPGSTLARMEAEYRAKHPEQPA